MITLKRYITHIYLLKSYLALTELIPVTTHATYNCHFHDSAYHPILSLKKNVLCWNADSICSYGEDERRL